MIFNWLECLLMVIILILVIILGIIWWCITGIAKEVDDFIRGFARRR
jgi:hypothetical protein